MIVFAVLVPIVAYLIGSISFAVIFTRAFSKTDVREHGSGNAGTTNVLRVAGKTAGILTFVCDALKGAVAALLGMLVFKAVFGGDADTLIMYGKYICGISCITNMAAGVQTSPLDHAEVQETADRVAATFSKVVTASIIAIADAIN